MAKIDLSKYGITGTTEIVYNPSYEVLFEEETKPELKGFEKVQLAPGETKTVTMELDKRSFAWYNTELHDWYAASGKYEILIGASSRDIRLSETIELSSSQVIPMHIHMNTTLGELFNNPNTKEQQKN